MGLHDDLIGSDQSLEQQRDISVGGLTQFGELNSRDEFRLMWSNRSVTTRARQRILRHLKGQLGILKINYLVCNSFSLIFLSEVVGTSNTNWTIDSAESCSSDIIKSSASSKKKKKKL